MCKETEPRNGPQWCGIELTLWRRNHWCPLKQRSDDLRGDTYPLTRSVDSWLIYFDTCDASRLLVDTCFACWLGVGCWLDDEIENKFVAHVAMNHDVLISGDVSIHHPKWVYTGCRTYFSRHVLIYIHTNHRWEHLKCFFCFRPIL